MATRARSRNPSAACARATSAFAAGDWTAHRSGLPYLADAQASLFCDADLVTRYGTHSIVVGKISHVIVGGHVAPLLYQDGQYTVGLGDGIDWVVPI